MRPHLFFCNTFVCMLLVLTLAYSQKLSPLDITIDREGVQLKGKFYITEKEGSYPTVILLHGFPGGEGDVLEIGAKLSEAGINVLIFNYSGTHHSEGEFNFDNSQKDIGTAFDFIIKSENITKFKIDTTRIILGGYSFGGGMALTYAANHPEINEVFSIAGNDHGVFMEEYNRNPELKKMIDEVFNDLKNQPEKVRFAPGGTPEEIVKMHIIKSNQTYHLLNSASLLAQKDILLIGGWDDQNVSFEGIILPLYRALKKEKVKSLKIADVKDNHSFKNSSEELAQIIIKWIKTAPVSNEYFQDKISSESDVTFDRNGVILNGTIFIPEGSGLFPAVIFLKGFYEPQDDYLGMSKSLSKAGFAILTFQYSGTDESEGEFSFKNTQKDIQAAYDFIHQPENIRKYNIDTTRIHLGGLSYGGGMALTYAADHPEIHSVFSIAGTDHAEFIREYTKNIDMKEWFDKWWEDLAAPKGPVRIADGFSIKAILEMGIDNYLPTLDLEKSTPLLIKKHILLIGGWDDMRSSFEHHILPLYRALNNEGAQKVKITAVQDNHSYKSSGPEIVQIIIEWLISVEMRGK